MYFVFIRLIKWSLEKFRLRTDHSQTAKGCPLCCFLIKGGGDSLACQVCFSHLACTRFPLGEAESRSWAFACKPGFWGRRPKLFASEKDWPQYIYLYFILRVQVARRSGGLLGKVRGASEYVGVTVTPRRPERLELANVPASQVTNAHRVLF